jgi:hypothetical protein
MPPHLVTRESERITAARGGGRTSARDLELMGEDDFNDLLEQVQDTPSMGPPPAATPPWDLLSIP